MSRRNEIVSVARRLLERDGPDGLTMRAIAAEMGIRAPSLYKHIADKHELEVALMTDCFVEQARAFTAAAADTDDPIGAFGAYYRSWALEHPHLYRLMTDRPVPRDDLPEGVEDAAAAPLVEAVGGDIDRARAVWAFAHGMVVLELAGRFPVDADLDEAWRIGLAGMTGRGHSSPPGSRPG